MAFRPLAMALADLLCPWDELRWRGNDLADFAAHFIMNPVRVIFVPHIFAAQLFLRLRGAEKIGRQFCAAHVIENMLLGLEPLALMEAHS